MGLIIRLHNITAPNDFKVEYKNLSAPYPLDSGYIEYGTFSGGTTQIEMYSDVSWAFNTIYWIKITDLVTNRYIIKSIYTNDETAFAECWTLEL